MLEECYKGNHKFKVIYYHNSSYGEEPTVRWCQVCGSVKIDIDMDNRIFSERIMKINSPKIAFDWQEKYEQKLST